MANYSGFKGFSIVRSGFPGSDQWITNLDYLVKKYESNSKDGGYEPGSRRRRLTFVQLTKKLMFSQRMSSNIVGTIKGKFLLESNLPDELGIIVGHQLGWEVGREGSTCRKDKAKKKDSEESDFSGSYTSSDDYSEEGDNPYDNFLERMDELDEGEGIEEIAASGLLTGLKSWLNFGSSVVQNAMADTEQKKVYLMGVLEPGEENNVIKSSRGPARTDDKLTRKAEERTNRITSDFCSWLRSLPFGDDETINHTPEAQIKALFDTTQSANPNKSKLAEGLKFWAKFGEQATGASLLRSDPNVKSSTTSNKWVSVVPKQVLKKSKRNRNLAYIASSQIAGKKFRRQYKLSRRRRLKKLIQMEEENDESDEEDANGGVRPFDHKEYGVWYTKPHTWEERFKKKRDVSKFTLLHTEIQKEKNSWATEDPHKNASLTKLESTRAFAEYIKKRNSNYDTPKFLRNVLAKSLHYNH